MGLARHPNPISLALATKSDPTSFRSDLGLVSKPHQYTLGLAVKPDPTVFGTRYTKDNAPSNTF